MMLGDSTDDRFLAMQAADALHAQKLMQSSQIAATIAAAYNYVAPTLIPVADPHARLIQQFKIINKLIKRDFSTDPSINSQLLDLLANYLQHFGVQNILDVWYFEDAANGLAFWYDIRTGVVVSMADDLTRKVFTQFTVGTSNYVFGLQYTKDHYPIFSDYSVYNGTTWTDVRTGIIFVGSVVLSAVGLPIASTIGNAVVGAEVAASYPALAQGVGQAVINTALNGGDVQRGVTSAVASFAGANVGGQVASATASDIIGQAAAAATSALINGGDIDKAVLQSLARNGVNSVQSVLLSGSGTAADQYAVPGSVDMASGASPVGFNAADLSAIGGLKMGQYYTDENGITYGVDDQGSLLVVDSIDESGIGYSTDANGNTIVLDAPTTAQISQVSPGVQTLGPGQDGTVPLTSSANPQGANLLSTLATTALSLVASYVKAGTPAIRTGTNSSTVNSNTGTVATRNANGTVTMQKPAVGTPYLAGNGSLVTNNGDGSFTVVNPNGAMVTKRYPGVGGVGGVNSKTLLIGGGVLLAVLALRR